MKTRRVLIDALLLTVCLALIGRIGVVAIRSVTVHADAEVVAREAKTLHDAFHRFYLRNQSFPTNDATPGFRLDTLDPLRERGYYSGNITTKLRDLRVDGYDTPDDRGRDREFWLEMTLRGDPSIRFLVARSDDAPMSGGLWCDGAYILRDGTLEPI